MTIEQIIDSFEVNNLEKNKLLICLLRNSDEYNSILKTEGIKLYPFGEYVSFSKIIEVILHCENDILVNYIIYCLKKNKNSIINLLKQ